MQSIGGACEKGALCELHIERIPHKTLQERHTCVLLGSQRVAVKVVQAPDSVCLSVSLHERQCSTFFLWLRAGRDLALLTSWTFRQS